MLVHLRCKAIDLKQQIQTFNKPQNVQRTRPRKQASRHRSTDWCPMTKTSLSYSNNDLRHICAYDMGVATIYLIAARFELAPPKRLVPKTSALDHSATLPVS